VGLRKKRQRERVDVARMVKEEDDTTLLRRNSRSESAIARERSRDARAKPYRFDATSNYRRKTLDFDVNNKISTFDQQPTSTKAR